MTIQDQRRKAFEEWYLRDSGFPAESVRRDKTGTYYINGDCMSAWEGWNAALDSLCVELPRPDEAMKTVLRYQDELRQNVTGTTNWAANLGMYVVDSCREAIHAAGIKTK